MAALDARAMASPESGAREGSTVSWSPPDVGNRLGAATESTPLREEFYDDARGIVNAFPRALVGNPRRPLGKCPVLSTRVRTQVV